MKKLFLALLFLPLPAFAALRGTTGVAGTSGTATSNTITYSGTAIQVGDLEILTTSYDPGGSTTFTDPSGWTACSTIGITDRTTGGTVFHCAVKIAAAGDTGTPSYTTTDAGAYGGWWNQQLRVYSGRVNSSVAAAFTPVSTTAPGASGSTPYTLSITGLTPAASSDVVVFTIGNVTAGGGGGVTYSASLTGFANLLVDNDTAQAASDPLLSLDYVNNPGGATGTLSESITSSGTTTMTPAAFVIAMPVASGSSSSPSQMFLGASLRQRPVSLEAMASQANYPWH